MLTYFFVVQLLITLLVDCAH